MSYERPRVEYYDSSTDEAFRTALVDQLLWPAKSLLESRHDRINESGPYLAATASVSQGEDVRAEYDFYASKSADDVLMHAWQLATIDDMSDEAVYLILNELPYSELEPREIAVYHRDPSKLLTEAVVEQYKCFTFKANLQTREVTVRTSIGVRVDGSEVDAILVSESAESSIDLDADRMTVFESDAMASLMNGLYCMGLVGEEDFRSFLKSF